MPDIPFYNPEDFVPTSDAVELTGKSASTIRNFYKKLEVDSPELIKEEENERGRPVFFIKYSALDEKFMINKGNNYKNTEERTIHADRIDQDHQQSFNDSQKQIMSAGFQLTTIKKENEYLRSQIHKPIYKNGVFWAVVIIIAILGVGWLYRQEIIKNFKEKINETKTLYEKEISFNKISHQKDLAAKDQEVSTLQSRLKEKEDYFKNILSNQKKLSELQERQIKKQEIEIADLQGKIEKLQNPDTKSSFF